MVNARGNLKAVVMFPSGRAGQEVKKTPQKGFRGIEHKMKQNKTFSRVGILLWRGSHGCQSKYKANILPASSGQEVPARLGSKSLLEAALCERQGWRPRSQAHPCRRH